MTKQQVEKKKTYQFLQDFCSTLDEISIYLSENNPIYKLIKASMEGDFSVDIIYEKILFVRQQIEINFLIENEYSRRFYEQLKDFVFSDLSILMDIFNLFFNKLMTQVTTVNEVNEKISKKSNTGDINPVKLFGASYFILNLNIKKLKNNINKYFNMGFQEHAALLVQEDNNPIWAVHKMKYKEFQSDINKIKNYAKEILTDCNIELSGDILLQLQISEFIKNAIRHGNKLDKAKKVKVWYDINNDYAKLIIEDEGEGFKDIEKWNEFNKHRNKYIESQDIQNVLKYAVYKTENSIEGDGGNFLFSAMEYWDSGINFNKKKNKLYVMKYFY